MKNKRKNNEPFHIKAVLFDFDGTLTKPGALNFPRLKETIGCPANVPVLEFTEDLPTLSQRNKALEHLERFEKEAAVRSVPNTGAQKLIHFLRSKKIGIGIITRNTLSSIERALQNFEDIDISHFDVIVSRETPGRPKPSGDGIILATETLNVDVKQILMVGDSIDRDIHPAAKLGLNTALAKYGQREYGKGEADYELRDIRDVLSIVQPKE